MESLSVGDDCFEAVEELELVGLRGLRRGAIGERSFTKQDYATHDGEDPDRHFCVRACEKLEELRIGNWSFMDYATCEIEEAAMLEVVEVGDVNAEEDCCCFYYADLELKGGGGGEG